MRTRLVSSLAWIGGLFGAVLIASVGLPTEPAHAAACTFTTSGSTMTLDADCTTTTTILVPNGMTLDGAGHSITAIDPPGDHFRGAVVRNGGPTASVKNLTVKTQGLANVCDAGDDRLRGIMFDGASGSIVGNQVLDVNQGASGCQEGNGIEVRNFGANPSTLAVEVAHNTILRWQKTGIVANGNVRVDVHHNTVGPSATQLNLAANSLQFGFGAAGSARHNTLAGNSWCCPSAAATGILLYEASGVEVSQNKVEGNADVGIYVETSSQVTLFNNQVGESGPDGAYDIGIGNYNGDDNTFRNNKVSGYTTPYEGVDGKNNQVKRAKPSP